MKKNILSGLLSFTILIMLPFNSYAEEILPCSSYDESFSVNEQRSDRYTENMMNHFLPQGYYKNKNESGCGLDILIKNIYKQTVSFF